MTRRTTWFLGLTLAMPLAGCAAEHVQVTPPRLVSPSTFQYPEELWDAGVEGETVLRIFVTAQGTVDSARVETPSKYTAFDSAAIAGSRRLRFEPARMGPEPVGRWYRLPVRFDLTPAAGAAAKPESTP